MSKKVKNELEKMIWNNQREISNETYVKLMLIEIDQTKLILDEFKTSGNSLRLHKNMLACRLAELQQTRHFLNGLNEVGKEITKKRMKASSSAKSIVEIQA